jgi:hypothetical protein
VPDSYHHLGHHAIGGSFSGGGELLVFNTLLESVQGDLLPSVSVFLYAKWKSVSFKCVKAPEVLLYAS